MGEYNHNALRFGVNNEEPEIQSTTIEDTIYSNIKKEFLGHEFVFNIIGSSHYIYCDNISYYEISSCEPVDASSIYTVQIDRDIDLEFSFESESVDTNTEVKSYDLDKFVKNKEYDLKYKFCEDAYTTINIENQSYTTWHTYPEFDLALFTRTNFLSF